jgi:hypothetical protein
MRLFGPRDRWQSPDRPATLAEMDAAIDELEAHIGFDPPLTVRRKIAADLEYPWQPENGAVDRRGVQLERAIEAQIARCVKESKAERADKARQAAANIGIKGKLGGLVAGEVGRHLGRLMAPLNDEWHQWQERAERLRDLAYWWTVEQAKRGRTEPGEGSSHR